VGTVASSKFLRRAGIGIAAAALLAGLLAYRHVRKSLPVVDGEIAISGLHSPVEIDRDANGVPAIRGESRADVARALGFLHGQERFFQMDLMRRRAAGELSEILGAGLVDADRRHRVHRMRERARRVVEAASPFEREILTAYVEGVNSGLEALGAPPFEYAILRAAPSPWLAEDTILVVLSMFFELNDAQGAYESMLGLLDDVLPADVAAFLSPRGSEWDAPLSGDVFVTPPVPSSTLVEPVVPVETGSAADSDIGSNNWAVAGSRTADGRALLANDMHLGHGVPNIWYRALLVVRGEPERRLVGVTLPGTPTLVAGSNGSVAWGFTNTTGDWSDVVEIERDPHDAARYRTPEGFRSFDVHREAIRVRGGEPIALEVRETIWGPLVEEDRAIRWIAHDVEAVNVKLALLEDVKTVAEALEAAAAIGIPPQNLVCADREGSIGWTVAGRIPRRVGFDGRLPRSWADGSRRWDGYLTAEEYPRIQNPDSGLIWTANARVVSGDDLAKIGDGGYAHGARAKQIRDDLLALDRATEEDMLRIQLDDRALFLEHWRDFFLEIMRGRPSLADVESTLRDGWTGRASVDSSGYRVVRELRRALFAKAMAPLVAGASAADPRFQLGQLRSWEGPLWKLVTERPAHLVPPPHATWEEAIVAIIEETSAAWPRPLERYTWGEANRSAIRHPLSNGVPLLGGFTDIPPRELPGDTDLPRVQARSHGASERIAVSPGREADALFHMPGGQSGHPLSPYYGAGHEDWEEGRPTPLLPGKPVYRLTLRISE
jgi:penicillin amidase